MSALCVSTDLTSNEWAAWVQAVGSILAIVAAFLVMIVQHALERSRAAQEQKESNLERLRVVAYVGMYAGSAVTIAFQATREYNSAEQFISGRGWVHRLNEAELALAFPLTEIVNTLAVQNVLQLRVVIAGVKEEIATVASVRGLSITDFVRLKHALDGYQERATQATQTLMEIAKIGAKMTH